LNTVAPLRRQKWPEQYEAIRVLAKSTDPLAEVVLLQLLELRAPEVREAAINALAERSEALGRMAARALLEDANPLVRDTAAAILGRTGSRQDVRRLLRALEDSRWVNRATVADSLGQVGGKTVHRALLHAMTHDVHPVVRRDAAYALSYARHSEVVPSLEQALGVERAEQARVGLLSALVALGRRERLPALLALLASEDSSVRHAVINSLREIVRAEETAQAVHAIRAMLEHEENPGLRTDAAQAIEKIFASVESD
jgi:HEAT repeat protein